MDKLIKEEESLNVDNDWLKALKENKVKLEASNPKKLDSSLLNTHQRRAIGR
jgi:hypothetical protein